MNSAVSKYRSTFIFYDVAYAFISKHKINLDAVLETDNTITQFT